VDPPRPKQKRRGHRPAPFGRSTLSSNVLIGRHASSWVECVVAAGHAVVGLPEEGGFDGAVGPPGEEPCGGGEVGLPGPEEPVTTVPEVPEGDGDDGPPGLAHEVGNTGTGVGVTATVPCRAGPAGGGSG
jgi:hypothetical protein